MCLRLPAWACRRLIGACFLLLLATPVVAEGFVPGIEDLPLASGLKALADTAVVFDTPSGRIVDAQAVGAVSVHAVKGFYRETLPQLGWRRLSDAQYSRGNELLVFEFMTPEPNQLTVKFSLRPAATTRP